MEKLITLNWLAKKKNSYCDEKDFWRKNALGKFISIPLKVKRVYLHGFSVIPHIEVGISQLAVNGTQCTEIVSSGLKRKWNQLNGSAGN